MELMNRPGTTEDANRNSLATKLTSATMVGSVLVGLILFVIGLGLYANALVGQYITESFSIARSSAVVVESLADTDALAREVLDIYHSSPEELRTDENSDAYRHQFDAVAAEEGYSNVYKALGTLRKQSDVNFLYLGVYDKDTGSLVYICDPDTDPATACFTGEWEIVEEDELAKFTGWDGKGKLHDIGRTKRHGYMCTSGYPVGDATDDLYVFVLADVTIGGVFSGIWRLTLQYAVVVIGVTYIIGRRLNRRLKKTLVDPLTSIGNAAVAYVHDKNQGITDAEHFSSLKIHTGDEIEHLSIIMSDMENSIREHEEEVIRLTAENERAHTELDLAARIQMNMLHTLFPPFPDRDDFDIYASMDPAKEIGGDFYDFFFIDDTHLCLVMADVAGKGIPAALFMMASMIIIGNTAVASEDYDPGEILEAANDMIYMHNSEDMFVTVWLGILDLATGLIKAANAGHEYPAVMHANGDFEILKDKHGFVLGTMENMKYKSYDLQLEPGSKLFLYTDGVPEATNEDEELFGTDRLIEVLNSVKNDTPDEILRSVKRATDLFVGKAPQFDDLTMLCLEFKKKYRKNPAGRKNRSWRRPGNMSKWIPEGYIQGGMKEKDWH